MAAGLAILLHGCLFLWSAQQAIRTPDAVDRSEAVTLIIAPATPPPARIVAQARPSLSPIVDTAMRPLHAEPDVTSAAPSRPRRSPRLLHARVMPPQRKHGAPVQPLAALASSGQPASLPFPPAPPMMASDRTALAELEVAIDHSVRAAAIMPEAAKRLHREGRVLVRFRYIDGTSGEATIVRSADFRPLDDAALRAVRLAAYPMAPNGLQGHRLDLLVWISFNLLPA